MSELGLGGHPGSHGTRHKRGRGCAAVMAARAVIGVVGGFAYVKGVDLIRGALSGPEDYSGKGEKPVITIEVEKGDIGADIGEKLSAAGVVKSAEAFTDAANQDDRAGSIQPGRYKLLSKMSAESALDVLVDPDSLIMNPTVTIPEGLRAKEILTRIVQQTDFTRKQVDAAYADTAGLKLPDYAKGDPEGYLFPSTYELAPNTDAADLLRAMVDRFKARADSLELEDRADKLGYSPHDVVTIASLVQAEAGSADMTKVASVVYNRLDVPMALQFDSTLHYAVDSRGEILAGRALREIDSPYNTYQLQGLPPTPIDSPGEEALVAALEPAKTDFIYFVTVDLKTGETRFAATYAEHQRNVAVYREYCETSDAC
ncbi:MAG: endolytic transglycosylase MltG [Actinomycetota bacterium]|nr:endolytic transglycosylase MltG [Actinomycetota bacterium]